MTTNQKKAYKQLKQNVQNFEKEKFFLHKNLLENQEYRSLYTQLQTLSINIAKQNKPCQKTQNQHKQTLSALEKVAKKLTNNSNLLWQEHMCKHCFDKGFVNQQPCSCLKQVMSQMLMKQSGLDLQALTLPKNDFSLFKNPQEIEQIYATLDKWALNFKNSKIKNWGFLGNTGTGKTHLMLYVLNNLIKQGYFVHFTTAFNLTQEMLSQHTDFEDKNRDYISKFLDCDVLFIDDMGTEPQYKNVNENYIYLILNQRMLENKPIIFSSNFDLAQFETFYGERIFSRLVNKRTSKMLWFDGFDLRLKDNNKTDKI